MLERVEGLPLLSVGLFADVLVLVEAVGGEAAAAHGARQAGAGRAARRRRHGASAALGRARAAGGPDGAAAAQALREYMLSYLCPSSLKFLPHSDS